jgi:hypothetical protein
MKVNIGKFYANGKQRTVKVQVDKWDTYNVDHTLSVIAVPLLKQFKESQGGCSWVDNEDVPKSMFVPDGEEYESELWGTRWTYVIDEMIFALECCADIDKQNEYNRSIGGFNVEKYKTTEERIDNGLRLFGKYFRALWS